MGRGKRGPEGRRRGAIDLLAGGPASGAGQPGASATAADSWCLWWPQVAGTDRAIVAGLRPRTGRRCLALQDACFGSSWWNVCHTFPRGHRAGGADVAPSAVLGGSRVVARGHRGAGCSWGGAGRAGVLGPAARSSVASGTRGCLLMRGSWAERWAPASPRIPLRAPCPPLELGALRPGRASVSRWSAPWRSLPGPEGGAEAGVSLPLHLPV